MGHRSDAHNRRSTDRSRTESSGGHAGAVDGPAPSNGGGVRGGRVLTVGRPAAVLLSTLASVIASGLLPEQIRIHWTLGMGPYYGPEFAPTVLVLAVFPVSVSILAIGTHWLEARFRKLNESTDLGPLYAGVVLLSLALLLSSQALVIGLNLG